MSHGVVVRPPLPPHKSDGPPQAVASSSVTDRGRMEDRMCVRSCHPSPPGDDPQGGGPRRQALAGIPNKHTFSLSISPSPSPSPSLPLSSSPSPLHPPHATITHHPLVPALQSCIPFPSVAHHPIPRLRIPQIPKAARAALYPLHRRPRPQALHPAPYTQNPRRPISSAERKRAELEVWRGVVCVCVA
ncbi:hypothetical protein K505DRAFT_320071 [Melanomma pulvis-pyrius CBS 109.77]|uniref:Uncharacterized protein n=1 Tax=Melanomma pulvis-pyrius CBS 109.77 TaxID=1314802 RepID=A0A6A6XXG4_9PLEO|nr:hypothetical protein K505DRAFT_320071 [Melanomma pulvis-pyrius CBS 109.77]